MFLDDLSDEQLQQPRSWDPVRVDVVLHLRKNASYELQCVRNYKHPVCDVATMWNRVSTLFAVPKMSNKPRRFKGNTPWAMKWSSLAAPPISDNQGLSPTTSQVSDAAPLPLLSLKKSGCLLQSSWSIQASEESQPSSQYLAQSVVWQGVKLPLCILLRCLVYRTPDPSTWPDRWINFCTPCSDIQDARNSNSCTFCQTCCLCRRHHRLSERQVH